MNGYKIQMRSIHLNENKEVVSLWGDMKKKCGLAQTFEPVLFDTEREAEWEIEELSNGDIMEYRVVEYDQKEEINLYHNQQ